MQRYRVLTFDNRGSGRAPCAPRGISIRDFARDALELLDAQGVQRAHIVGRSMGGMIAQELALQAPERVQRLVLVSTTGRVDGHLAEVFGTWARLAEAGVPADLRHRSSLLWCLGSAALAGDGAARRYLDARAKCDRPMDYARQAWACGRHDALTRLSGLHCPTLVVGGSDDRLTPPAHARALADAIPGARLCTIPGAGHLAYLESPERFGAELFSFLEGEDRPCLKATTR